MLFDVPLPDQTPCISRYIISSKMMSSQLPALALRFQYLRCETVCAGNGTVRRHIQIYWNKLVHLVGFTIEIYYDARNYERQIYQCQTGKGNISI